VVSQGIYLRLTAKIASDQGGYQGVDISTNFAQLDTSPPFPTAPVHALTGHTHLHPETKPLVGFRTLLLWESSGFGEGGEGYLQVGELSLSLSSFREGFGCPTGVILGAGLPGLYCDCMLLSGLHVIGLAVCDICPMYAVSLTTMKMYSRGIRSTEIRYTHHSNFDITAFFPE
jgi:hypothetical protein